MDESSSSRKQTSSSIRRRRHNPFEARQSFPDFDQAIRHTSAIRPRDPPTVDQSICSHATTSSLNLSIGAQAALNDHLRHLAKHGLDDSQYSARLQLAAAAAADNDDSHDGDPMDKLWDKLLDQSSSNHSINHSLLNIVSADTLECHDHVVAFSVHNNNNNTDDDEAAGDSQEVEVVAAAADQSSDFFNSSRVMTLMTPDRYRGTRINAITTRGGERPGGDESFTSEASSNPGDTSLALPPSMQHLFLQATDRMDISGRSDIILAAEEAAASAIDNSFSLSAVDLSRISADGSEDLGGGGGGGGTKQRSPDSSFVLLGDHRTTIDESSPYIFPEGIIASPVRASPTRRFRGDSSNSTNKSSSSSSFRRSPPRSVFHRLSSSHHHRTSFAASSSSSSSSPQRKGSPPRPNTAENMPNFADDNRLALSPIRSQVSGTILAPLPPPQYHHRKTTPPPPPRPLFGGESSSSLPRGGAVSLPPRRRGQERPHHQQQQQVQQHDSSSSSSLTLRNMVLECKTQSTSRGAAATAAASNDDHSDDVSTLHNNSSSEQNNTSGAGKNSMSSSSSSLLLSNEEALSSTSSRPPTQFSVGDRRRFRTVVPTRVFWTDPDEFPEPYDSFSVPPPSSRRTSRVPTHSTRSVQSALM